MDPFWIPISGASCDIPQLEEDCAAGCRRDMVFEQLDERGIRALEDATRESGPDTLSSDAENRPGDSANTTINGIDSDPPLAWACLAASGFNDHG